MKDRGIIKWQPFDSLTSSKNMVQHILSEKEKINKPVLSEEQLREIQERLWEGFHNQIPLHITYFFKGKYQMKKNVIVLNISLRDKKILLEDYSSLYFDQIIGITNN